MKNKLLLLLLAAASFWGCNSTYDTYQGPDVSVQLQPFRLIAPVRPKPDSTFVDFDKAGTVYFKAKFNRIATWTLKLKGTQSGAQSSISGVSSYLDAANAQWTGRVDTLPSFLDGETISVTLILPDSSYPQSSFVLVHKPKPDNSVKSLLITDFEPGNLIFGSNNIQPGDSATFKRTSDTSKPFTHAGEGHWYFDISGQEASYRNDYYIGAYTIPASYSDKSQLYFPLHTSADSLYFNVMVYGAGRANTNLAIQFQEDDKFPYAGVFKPAVNDMYVQNINVNWTGWKLVSIRYSDTRTVNYYPGPGQNGNRIHEPEKIANIVFSLSTNPSGFNAGPAISKIDYPIFTFGAPFKP